MNSEEKGKKRGPIRAILSFLLLALLIAGAVFLIKNSDSLSRDGLGQVIDDLAGTHVSSDSLSFDVYSDNVFAALGDGLAVASGMGVEYVSGSGEKRVSESVSLKSPVLSGGGGLAAAWSPGGTELRVIDTGGVRLSLTNKMPIVSVSLSAGGYMAVTAQEGGYKGSVTVYDPAMKAVYRWSAGESYPVCAAVSPQGRYMAAVTYSDAGSRVKLFSLESEEERGVWESPDTLCCDARFLSENALAVLSPEGVALLDSSGRLTGSFDCGSEYLSNYSLEGEGFVTLALSRYRLGSMGRLVTVNGAGEALGEAETDGEIRSLSAAGKYIAVLYSDRLVVYNSGLEEQYTLADVSGLESAVMRSDGSVILVSSQSAVIYTRG